MLLVDDSFELVLYQNLGQVTRAVLHSKRPLEIQNLLVGRGPEEVLELLARLYPIGGKAQVFAALLALEEAYGLHPNPYHHKARALLVHFENLAQTWVRVEQDWAKLLGNPAPVLPPVGLLEERLTRALYGDHPPFFFGDFTPKADVRVIGEVALEARTGLEERLLGTSLDLFLKWTQGQWAQWLENDSALGARVLRYYRQLPALKNPLVPILPWASEQEWHKVLSSADAVGMLYHPVLAGKPQETGAFARTEKSPLLQAYLKTNPNLAVSRVLARLVDLGQSLKFLSQGLEIAVASTGVSKKSGLGLAQVESARGRLVHRLRVEADKILQYQIISPQQWNLCPKGVFLQALVGVKGSDKPGLARLARAWSKALDPFLEMPVKILQEEEL
ncbi:MAG: hypothetical protein A2600_08315 [Candidatus Lambdaproteobacteria bacterium RIFOXYD1_FULL_56_27]|uniref:Uncharacterized protein n=1 Tax=Candidatus Lambdaproteobacteria bacterium RIFOXYD2_FULL_56_26 TaxID=1817773 RepID=A0A1F6H060_9PROT|nr:MAG: hypothetical protein A2426_06765 [Candidatus Lambdaproteobacteria bacterium RIFOXYC1_FULL_56_13]OGH03788.1 MAG: hypothetical protein A2557_13640 [Candidatus Lambdaproteobacteria bacterium RIFOXYD2_FULL_56_26]OGH08783.1 MAG: hypothetical protein A2600_08315 [Candidatus Lambdaproteobacteria bacterium RIFOXYD1_FULL_56_27]